MNGEAHNPSSYGDAFADVYDDWYDDLDDDDFIAHVAGLMPSRNALVLELGAGTGRLIEKLQHLRFGRDDHIVALDASDAMLQRLTARKLPRVTTVRADMCDFRIDDECDPSFPRVPERAFDMVFVGYNTIFNVPDENGLRHCFECSVQCLAGDGHFVLDAVVPRGGEGETVTVKLATPSHVVLSVSNHDAAVQRITGEFLEFEGDACVRRRPWSVSYFSPAQLDAIADRAGLSLVERHGDSVGMPFTDQSARHVSVYRPKTT